MGSKFKHKKTRRSGGQSGQAAVEFALTLVLLVTVIFAFLQLCLLLAFGNFVHYATFMSARAYLSAGVGEDQRTRADSIVKKMLKKSEGDDTDRWPGLLDGRGQAEIGFGPKGDDKDFARAWIQGVRYRFRGKLLTFPFAKSHSNAGGSASGKNSVELISESYLGRETTKGECEARVQALNGGVLDNGC